MAVDSARDLSDCLYALVCALRLAIDGHLETLHASHAGHTYAYVASITRCRPGIALHFDVEIEIGLSIAGILMNYRFCIGSL